MSLNPDLTRLEALKGTVVPNRTVRLSRRMHEYGHPDTVAQITKVSVAGTPPGDYFFRLTLPDKPDDPRGGIEVDATHEGDVPSLKIVARGIFEEEAGVLGTMARVALEEAGVEQAVIDPSNSNLTPEFLMRAGGQALEAPGGDQAGQVLVFYPAPPTSINNHSLAA